MQNWSTVICSVLIGYIHPFNNFSGKKTRLEGAYLVGWYGIIVLNIIGFLYLAFVCVISNFPSIEPVINMNYTLAVTGLVMLISAVFWITTGWQHFTGPDADNLIGQH